MYVDCLHHKKNQMPHVPPAFFTVYIEVTWESLFISWDLGPKILAPHPLRRLLMYFDLIYGVTEDTVYDQPEYLYERTLKDLLYSEDRCVQIGIE